MDQPPRIGRYSLVRRVGAGGFATVWLARDEQLDADVAVKILSDNWIEDYDVRRRFLAEGRFLRRVDSLYVVGVHDIGEADDGRPFMVLTYADGGTLADRIKAGPLEFAEAVRVITQVGRGLKHLHARGVLHRDVKPANVLFHSDPAGDRAMLSDLGLGKSLAEVSRITLPGGTPAYVAPEQVRGERLDHRADLYSLGAVAYAAFTGQAPHGVASLAAVMQIEKPPPSMTTLREDVPDAIDVVVRRALEPDRDKRWPDLDSFLNALREAHTTGKVPPGLVPAADMPAPAPATGDVDQATALSGASQQTTANRQADPTQPTDPTQATGAAQATDSTQPVGAGRPPAIRPKRSARAAVITVLIALLLAAGGGYGGYEYVKSRPVKVEDKPLSVEVPRDWSQKAVDPGESLVVSKDIATWQTDPKTEGVFVGLVASPTLPTSAAAPPGCTAGSPDRGETPDGQQIVTFQHSCGPNPSVLEQYRQVNDTTQLRIQVRDDNNEGRVTVANSATYSP